jgi:hypothetical protein
VHRYSLPLTARVRVRSTVSVARLLSGEGASSTVYDVARGYYVNTMVCVLPTVHVEQGSARQARAGSISMRDGQKV